jgi:hypothetical protein
MRFLNRRRELILDGINGITKLIKLTEFFWLRKAGKTTMKKIIFIGMLTGGAVGLVLGLSGCSNTTGSSTLSALSGTPAATTGSTVNAAVEAALPLVRTGAAVATGAVLDFAVNQAGTRTRLANEMYSAANAVYSLSGGTFPTPAQFQSSIMAFGGTQTDASYAAFSTAIAGLYAGYYPKLVAGANTKTAIDLLNAIAGGIEDATQAYVTTPVAGGSVAAATAQF